MNSKLLNKDNITLADIGEHVESLMESLNSCDPRVPVLTKAAKMLKEQRIEVESVFGTIFAQAGGDPSYPGISLSVEFNDRSEYDDTIAMLEATPPIIKHDDTHVLRLLLWEDNEYEDYSQEFTLCVKKHGKDEQ